MKKKYWKPEAEIMEVELEQMIALSTTGTPADPDLEGLSREIEVFDVTYFDE